MGYARVSTDDWNLDSQMSAVNQDGTWTDRAAMESIDNFDDPVAEAYGGLGYISKRLLTNKVIR